MLAARRRSLAEVYHFRRLNIASLPESGDRGVWLEAFQGELTQRARCAVHGSDGRAASADAVFFHNQVEACEALLAMLVRRRPADAWFWPVVSGSAPGPSSSDRLVDLIETLRASPVSWGAVAAAVMELLEADDPVPLLNLLPDAAAARWVRQLGGDRAPWPAVGGPASTQTALEPSQPDRVDADVVWRASLGVEFPGSTQTVLARATAALGRNDNRVVWLASLAVVLARPSHLETGAVVARARASLSAFPPTAPRRALDGSQGPMQTDSAPKGETADKGPAAPSQNVDLASPPRTDRIEVGQAAPIEDENSGRTLETIPPAPISERPDWASRPGRCFGEATLGAGLYFLLNALSRLKTDNDLFDPGFLAHFFQHVARRAGIAIDDPILLCTGGVLQQLGPSDIDERLVRIWAMRVRRWCWQNARISAGEIVRRPGEVTLTGTDLDVSIPLDLADVRIRRVGLDLDPGWVPWFGRVVRFHYLTRAGLHA